MGVGEHNRTEVDAGLNQHAGPQPEETVEALDPEMTGRWLVTTQGSTHVWDLDARTYERRPGPASRAGAFEYDGVPHRITRVIWWPKVGQRSFLWFDDPATPWLVEHYRVSSTIAEIRRLTDAPRPGPRPTEPR